MNGILWTVFFVAAIGAIFLAGMAANIKGEN
jgi:hypothetical protein